ncbi:MAG: putative quinol monooxygenase [Cognatishimia sp.]
MLIAHVMFQVAATDRAAALQTLLDECDAVRRMQGCIAFIPFVDPTGDTGLGVLHEWDSAEAFAAYTSSVEFTAVGQALRPIMIGPPVSKRFDASLIEALN